MSEGTFGQLDIAKDFVKDDFQVGDSDGSDNEHDLTIVDNDIPDNMTDMVLEDAISSQDASNLVVNHGKDMKHAKKLAKKIKVKLLSYKAEKAKLKQKVSELNLKLVTKESTITNLEKNCDTLTDKCNKGMMQLIEAKEENKNLSLRVLEQIKTIAKLEGGGSQNGELGQMRSENKELTNQIEKFKATIAQLSKQLGAAKEASKSIEKATSSQVEEVNRLKEELVEATKTKELLQGKTEEVVKSASTIANLTQEKKDLFEAVRKSSQMAGKVKSLQKEIAPLGPQKKSLGLKFPC